MVVEMQEQMMGKDPFDIEVVMEQVGEAVKPYPKAAMFELADEGFRSPFEQLVACMISIRTLDEVSIRLARRLFARARTPEAVSQLSAAHSTNGKPRRSWLFPNSWWPIMAENCPAMKS